MGTAPREPGGVGGEGTAHFGGPPGLRSQVGIPSGHLLTRVGAAQRPEHTGLAAVSPPSGRLVALTGPAPLLHHSPCICQEPQQGKSLEVPHDVRHRLCSWVPAQENENICLHENVYMKAHSSLTHKGQKVETAECPWMDEWTDKGRPIRTVEYDSSLERKVLHVLQRG